MGSRISTVGIADIHAATEETARYLPPPLAYQWGQEARECYDCHKRKICEFVNMPDYRKVHINLSKDTVVESVVGPKRVMLCRSCRGHRPYCY